MPGSSKPLARSRLSLPSSRRLQLGALVVLAGVVALALELGEGHSHSPAQPRPKAHPNIIFVFVDDEPARYMRGLPFVRSLRWAKFTSASINNPRCCPSRSTTLTGRYSQHTGVETNDDAGNLDDSSTLATWLDPAYRTALIGKYLNQWDRKIAGPRYIPPGWDRWFAHFGRFDHYDYSVSDDRKLRHFGKRPKDYGTRVYGEQALRFIRGSSKPFFLYFTPLAPHTPFTPSRAHADDLRDYKPKLPPNFNRADEGAPDFYRKRPKTTRKLEHKRIRAINRMLESVDSTVRRMVTLLRKQRELDNTYIIFSSDNGLSLGSHRWWRKGCPYEECTRVPLLMRGPGIKPGRIELPVSNADFAPTIADLAGVRVPGSVALDGKSLVRYLRRKPGLPTHRTILLHSVAVQGQGPGFWGLRTQRWKYIESEDGSIELYDLRSDRYELRNLGSDPAYAGTRQALSARLAALRQ